MSTARDFFVLSLCALALLLDGSRALSQTPANSPDIRGAWGPVVNPFANEPPLVVNYPDGTSTVSVTVNDLEIGHAVLLPNSNKLLIWNPQFVSLPSGDKSETFRLWVMDPVMGTLDRIPLWNSSTNSGLGVDLFCSGHTHRKDGTILIAGGNDTVTSLRAHVFDPQTSQVTALLKNGDPNVLGDARYYPTVITLPDGSSMVIGGTRFTVSDPGQSSPSSGGWDIFQEAANPQWFTQALVDQTWEWYPRAFVLAGGSVFVPFDDHPGNLHANLIQEIASWTLGYSTTVPAASSVTKHSAASLQWKWNHYQGSAAILLQLDGAGSPPTYRSRVFAGYGTPHLTSAHDFGLDASGNPYLPTQEPEMPSANRDVNEFAFTGGNVSMIEKQGLDFLHRRTFSNLVVLPTGKLLALGGWRYDKEQLTHAPADPVYHPEIIDPGAAFELQGTRYEMNPHCLHRLYHEVAILLPDGRVLLMGGENEDDPNLLPSPHGNCFGALPARTYEIFEPPYLHQGSRPGILSVSNSQFGFGQSFSVSSRNSDIGKIVLMRPGSVTHMFDSDQRYVELSFQPGSPAGSGTFTYDVVAPPDGSVAPPGWYMLFIVTAPPSSVPPGEPRHGVPSVAAWVHVE